MTSTTKLTAARYGKDLVRVFRIVRGEKWQEVVEYTVCCLLEGAIEEAYTKADNASIVATDSIKNTIYCKSACYTVGKQSSKKRLADYAKVSKNILKPERFGLEIALHFIEKYAHISKAHVDIKQHKWSRIPVDGKPHPHSFVRDGEEKRIVNITLDGTNRKHLTASLKGGLIDLLVLKSSGSAFENFVRDDFTTLPDVSDRIFSTSVTNSYTVSLPSPFPTSVDNVSLDFEKIFNSVLETTLEIFAIDESASVQATMFKMGEKILKDNKDVLDVSYALPNKHYFAFNLDWKNLPNTKPHDAEVFYPAAAPSGLIEATMTRA